MIIETVGDSTKQFVFAAHRSPERKCPTNRGDEAPDSRLRRLRCDAATFLRKEFGLDAARVIPGHTSAAVTEIYAELDRKQAAEIMGVVG